MPQWTSQAEISHLWLAPGKPQSQVAISALTPDVVPNGLPIKKSKPVTSVSLYTCIEHLYQIMIQELDSDEHIVLARLSSVHYLHNVRLLTTYLRKNESVNLVCYISAFV